MKKKISIALLSLTLIISLAVSAFAAGGAGKLIDDAASLLNEEQYSRLSAKLDEISEKHDLDIAVVTSTGLAGKTAQAYADDAYDINGYGRGDEKDGVLLLICVDSQSGEGDVCISTCGYGITAFTDKGIKYIIDEITPELSEKKYDEAIEKYAELCDDLIKQAKDGKPYGASEEDDGSLSLVWIPISILIGFVIASIVVSSMKAQLKSVRKQTAAASYVKENGVNITDRRDLFLYRTVTKKEKSNNNNNSSSSSSTHTSASGQTHGGGGGKF